MAVGTAAAVLAFTARRLKNVLHQPARRAACTRARTSDVHSSPLRISGATCAAARGASAPPRSANAGSSAAIFARASATTSVSRTQGSTPGPKHTPPCLRSNVSQWPRHHCPCAFLKQARGARQHSAAARFLQRGAHGGEGISQPLRKAQARTLSAAREDAGSAHSDPACVHARSPSRTCERRQQSIAGYLPNRHLRVGLGCRKRTAAAASRTALVLRQRAEHSRTRKSATPLDIAAPQRTPRAVTARPPPISGNPL